MNRMEFLEKLRQALEMNVSPQVIRENLDYYGQYISDEVRKGRSEQEVLDELGDPWVIAKTIIDTQGDQGNAETIYDTPRQEYGRQESARGNARGFRFNTWWKSVLLMLCIIGVICLVLAAITGLISLIAPVLVPVLIIVIFVRILRGRS